PARFSTKNCCLNALASSAAMSRPNWSALPPGENATTILTGRLGQSSAHAGAMEPSESTARRAVAKRPIPRIVYPPLPACAAPLGGRLLPEARIVEPYSKGKSGRAAVAENGVTDRPFVPFVAGRATGTHFLLANSQQRADLALDAAVDLAAGRRTDED